MRKNKISPKRSAPIEPLVKFDMLFYRMLGFITKFCGLDVMDPNFRISVHTVVFATFVVMALLCVGYTVWAYDLENALNSISTLGLGTQVGCVKSVYDCV